MIFIIHEIPLCSYYFMLINLYVCVYVGKHDI